MQEESIVESKAGSPTRAPQDSKIESKLQPAKTKDDGDCAIHACLGVKNVSGVYECKEAQTYRNGMRQALKENKADLILRELAISGIKELMMSGRSIGAASKNWLKHYQEFLDEQYISSTALWEIFENVLREDRHKNALDYIQENHEHPLGDAAKLRDKFFDALNRNDGELYGIILSLPALDTAFKLYNELSQTKFDWEAMPKAVIDEYADFIGTPKQWLLPSDIAVLARTADITVIYYTYAGAEPLILNPGQAKEVPIQFDGRGHFERLVPVPISSAPEPKKEKKEIDASPSTPKTSESKKEQKEEEENTEEPDLPFDSASIPSAETINNKDAQGIAAIHHAASTGNRKTLEALLAKDADINLLTGNGLTALHLAAKKGYWKCVQILLSHNADPALRDADQRDFVHYLALYSKPSTPVDELLKAIPNPTRVKLKHVKDKNGQTALHYAAAKNRVTVIKALVQAGWRINAQDVQGNTALHLAAVEGNVEAVIQLLAEDRANIYLLNDEGETAFSLAERTGQYEVVEILEKYCNKNLTLPEDTEFQEKWGIYKKMRKAWLDKLRRRPPLQLEISGTLTLKKLREQKREVISLGKTLEINAEDLRYDRITNSILQCFKILEPNCPFVFEILLAYSDIVLLEANNKADDIPKTDFEIIFKHYCEALRYAAAAFYHASQYRGPQSIADLQAKAETQMQRIIIHYRMHVFGIKGTLPLEQISSWREKRLRIQIHRQSLSEKLITHPIKTLCEENTKFFKDLSKIFWDETLQLVHAPPCNYALIVLGSMSAQEMGPYSDLEFAIILPEMTTPKTDELYHEKRFYFQRTSGLMILLTITLIETPGKLPLQFKNDVYLWQTARGFGLDDASNNPASNPGSFLGSCHTLLEAQIQAHKSRNPVQNMFLKTEFLVGSEELHSDYRLQLSMLLNRDANSRRVLAIQQMKDDIRQYGAATHSENIFKALREKDYFKDYFNVKEDLYRILTRTIANLAMFYEIPETNNFKRIIALEKNGHISRAVAHTLTDLLEKILRLRFITQLHYGEEQENMYHPDLVPAPEHEFEKPVFILSKPQYLELVEIFQKLQRLEEAREIFIASEGRVNPFVAKVSPLDRPLSAPSESKLETAALMPGFYEILLQPQKAHEWYIRTIGIDPNIKKLRVGFLRFLHKQYHYYESSLHSGLDQSLLWVKRLVQSCLESKLSPEECAAQFIQLPPIPKEWRETFYREIQVHTTGDNRKAILAKLPKQEGAESKAEAPEGPRARTFPLPKSLVQAKQKLAERRRKPTDLALLPAWEREHRVKQVEMYQTLLWTEKLSPAERIALIQEGLPIFAEVQIDRDKQKTDLQKQRDKELSIYVGFLLAQKELPKGFGEVFQKLPKSLRQAFTFEILSQWEKAIWTISPASPTQSAAIPFSSPAKLDKKREYTPSKDPNYLESILKELNRIRGEEAEETHMQQKKRWRVIFQGFVAMRPEEAKQGQVTLSSPYLGSSAPGKKATATLSKHIERELFDEKLQPREDKRLKNAQRVVIPLVVHTELGDIPVHCKMRPEMPGMSRLIELMHEHFFGHGTSRSEVVQFSVGRTTFPGLISETVSGETLEVVLKKYPEKLQKLSHSHFSELALMAMFTNPEDGIPRNYIVHPLDAEESAFALVCVDNDHALFSAFGSMQDSAEEQLQVKTTLFCLDQILRPIDATTREAFCKIDLMEKLRAVLHEAEKQNTYYAELFGQKTMDRLHREKNDKDACTIPIPLKKNAAVIIYQKMLRLQRYLSDPKNHQATLLDCLLQIEPRVGARYRKAFETVNDPYERVRVIGNYTVTPEGYITSMASARSSIATRMYRGVAEYETLENLSPAQSLAELDRMEYQHAHLAEYQAEAQRGDFRRFKTLKAPEHKAMVVSGDPKRSIPALRWENLTTNIQSSLLSTPFAQPAIAEQKSEYLNLLQGELLDLLEDVPFQNLHLAHCKALSKSRLEKFIRNSPDLVSLDLSHIQHIELSDLLQLQHHPSLQILILKDLKSLKSIQRLALPALKILIINDAANLEFIQINSPNLEEIQVRNCKKLRRIYTNSTKLKKLDCQGAEELTVKGMESATQNWSAVTLISSDGCKKLVRWEFVARQYPFLLSYLGIKIIEDNLDKIIKVLNSIAGVEKIKHLKAKHRQQLMLAIGIFFMHAAAKKEILSLLEEDRGIIPKYILSSDPKLIDELLPLFLHESPDPTILIDFIRKYPETIEKIFPKLISFLYSKKYRINILLIFAEVQKIKPSLCEEILKQVLFYKNEAEDFDYVFNIRAKSLILESIKIDPHMALRVIPTNVEAYSEYLSFAHALIHNQSKSIKAKEAKKYLKKIFSHYLEPDSLNIVFLNNLLQQNKEFSQYAFYIWGVSLFEVLREDDNIMEHNISIFKKALIEKRTIKTIHYCYVRHALVEIIKTNIELAHDAFKATIVFPSEDGYSSFKEMGIFIGEIIKINPALIDEAFRFYKNILEKMYSEKKSEYFFIEAINILSIIVAEKPELAEEALKALMPYLDYQSPYYLFGPEQQHVQIAAIRAIGKICKTNPKLTHDPISIFFKRWGYCLKQEGKNDRHNVDYAISQEISCIESIAEVCSDEPNKAIFIFYLIKGFMGRSNICYDSLTQTYTRDFSVSAFENVFESLIRSISKDWTASENLIKALQPFFDNENLAVRVAAAQNLFILGSKLKLLEKNSLEEALQNILEKSDEETALAASAILSDDLLLANQSLKIAVAHAGKKDNAFSNMDKFYWFKPANMLTLAHEIRQKKLSYIFKNSHRKYEFKMPPNDRFSAYHENHEGIFIADPYAIMDDLSFGTFLTEDVNIITGANPAQGYNNPWTKLPETLLIPFFKSNCPGIIRIQIDYDAAKFTVLWDMPSGGKYVSEAMREKLLPILQTQIKRLIMAYRTKTASTTSGSTARQISEVPYDSFVKKLDQQGEAYHDGVPIILQNLCDYITHNTQPNQAFSSDPCLLYTIPGAKAPNRSTVMEKVRKENTDLLTRIGSSPTPQPSAHIVNRQQNQNKALEQEIARKIRQVSQVKPEALAEKITALATDAMEILFVIMDNQRLLHPGMDNTAPYSSAELEAAYQVLYPPKKLKEEKGEAVGPLAAQDLPVAASGVPLLVDALPSQVSFAQSVSSSVLDSKSEEDRDVFHLPKSPALLDASAPPAGVASAMPFFSSSALASSSPEPSPSPQLSLVEIDRLLEEVSALIDIYYSPAIPHAADRRKELLRQWADFNKRKGSLSSQDIRNLISLKENLQGLALPAKEIQSSQMSFPT